MFYNPSCILHILSAVYHHFLESGSEVSTVNPEILLEPFMRFGAFYWYLPYFVGKGSMGVTHGIFLESFMHFCQLFTIVCSAVRIGIFKQSCFHPIFNF